MGKPPKAQIFEAVQKMGENLSFQTLEATGPPHNRKFVIELSITDGTLSKKFTAVGRSIKEAENNAAREALIALAEQRKQMGFG